MGEGDAQDLMLIATGTGMSFCSISGKLIKMIDVSNNRLTKLTLPASRELRTLKCRNNELTTLTIPSECQNLESLDVANNRLTSLELMNLFSNLREIRLENNELSDVDFTKVGYIKIVNPRLGISHKAPGPLEVVNVMNNKLDESSMRTLLDRPNPTRQSQNMNGKTFNVGFLVKDRYSGRDYNYTPKSLISKCNKVQYTYELEKGENPSKINPNVKLYAGEEADYYSIFVTPTEHGQVLVNNIPDLERVKMGQRVSLLVFPEEGYYLKQLMANDLDVTKSKSFILIKATTINAKFEKKTFEVKLLQPKEGGNLGVMGYNKDQLKAVPYGTELTVVVTPNEGYELAKLTANGVDILTSKKFIVKEETTVAATFKKKTFNVTISPEVNGGVVTITGCDNLKSVPYGTELTVVVTPNEGYELAKLTANGVDILTSKKFIVRGNTTILATFVLSNELIVISESKVFPNPTKGLLHMPITDNMIVSIYSLNGMKIAERVVSGGCIDLSDLPSGQYLLTTSDGYQASVTKIE